MNARNGGFLNNRLNYILARKKKAQKDNNDEKTNIKADETNNNVDPVSIQDIQSMKTIIICKKNMDLMEERLNATHAYRLRMHKDNNVDLKEYFPYFFSHPKQMVQTNLA